MTRFFQIAHRFLLCLFLCGLAHGSLAQDNKEKPKVKLSGSISSELSTYNSSSQFKHRDPVSFRVYGSTRLNIDKWDIPINFIYSTQKNLLSQSINRFGISPTYNKWLRFHLGNRRVKFSSMSLNGKSFLGAGVEVQAGLFRAGAVYGRFNRAFRIDSVDYQFSTYSRRGYAGRLGVGTRFNFVDLIVFKAQDDAASLNLLPADSSAYIAPAGNTILALNSKQRIFKKVFFELEAAISAYNNDLNAAPIASENDLVTFLQSVLPNQGQNQYLTGLKSKLHYKSGSFNIGMDYMRIEPEFKSMGSYYIRDDIERFSGFTRYSTKDRKLSGTARIGVQRNNVLNNRIANNYQNINDFQLNYLPSDQWSFNAAYSNFISRSTLELAGLEDSTLLDQRYNNYNLGINYKVKNDQLTQMLRFTGGYQQTLANQLNNDFGSFNLRLLYRYNNKFNGIMLQPQMVYNRYTIASVQTNRFSPGVMFGWKSSEKLNTNLHSTFAFENRLNQRQATVFKNQLTTRYEFNKKQYLSLRVIFSNSRYSSFSIANGVTFQSVLKYGIRF